MAHWLPPARTKVFLTRPKHMDLGQLKAPTGFTLSTSPIAVPPSVRVVAGRPMLFAAVGVLSMLATYSAYYSIVLLPEEQEDAGDGDGGGGMGSGSATDVTAPMLGQQRWRRLDDGDHETMMSYFLVREP